MPHTVRTRVGTVVLTALLLVSVIGCSTTEPTDERGQRATEFVKNYAAIAEANYADALAAATALRTALQSFVSAPSVATMTAAKDAYVAARTPYLQTEVFRFYGGPIDGANGPEGLINGWPMDEAFVDYIVTDPDAGIINRPDLYPEITPELIASLNESGGETNISCGFHAIEFLLWGQDLSTTSAGERSHEDYVTASSGPGQHALRRGAYLMAVADLLVADLALVHAAWKEQPGSYRMQFVANGEASVELILTGLVRFTLGEFAGERMTVAFTTADQEDEHSCFSDLTHIDIVYDQKGVVNIVEGEYQRIDGSFVTGTGLYDLISSVDDRIAVNMDVATNTASIACSGIQAPFDLELTTPAGRARVKEAIDAIEAEGAAIQDGALKLGYTISGELE